MGYRDLVSVSRHISRPVFWNLGLESLTSRLGLEVFRSRSGAPRVETLHRLFFMRFCRKEFHFSFERVLLLSTASPPRYRGRCWAVIRLSHRPAPSNRVVRRGVGGGGVSYVVVVRKTDELLCGGYKWVSRFEAPCSCSRWTGERWVEQVSWLHGTAS